MDLRFQDYMIEHGIRAQTLSPWYASTKWCIRKAKQNSIRHGRSMMSFAQLPDSFWEYAVVTTTYILNMVPSKSVSETPYELWKGCKGSLRHFRIWGCPAHVLLQNPKKLERRSKQSVCIKKRYIFRGRTRKKSSTSQQTSIK